MKNISLLFFLLFFLPIALFSQKGTISGKIIDKTTGEELIGVSIKVESKTVSTGTVSDIEGKFLLSLEPDTYTLTFIYNSYKTDKLEVAVKPGEVTYANFPMEESSNQLSEVVIVYTVEKSSSLALLSERKNAAQVSDGISADMIRKTPDRTTSDVLKRVTGASIQDNKFAVIRGMNDRYNAGYLDGALLPSTESDRKAFAFDVIPANLIDNLQIIKGGTPDLVGDFGGGIIRINTKAVPEKFTQSINIGGQYHSLTTSKGFTEFKKYPGESFNIISPKRDLPVFDDMALRSASTFPTSEEKRQFADISQLFNNDWSNQSIKAPLNTRVAYSLGLPVLLNNDKKLGFVMALNYSNTRRFSKATINSYDGTGQISGFKDNVFAQNISSGGILNLNYSGVKTQLSLRNLLNVNTDNNTVARTGTGNIQDAVDVQNMANLINYNRLYNSILSLRQIVGNNLFSINASANFSSIRRRIPDYRIVSYTITPDFDAYRLTLGDFFNSSSGRFFSDLNEKLYGGNLDLSKQLDAKHVKTEIKAGGYYQKRNRTFESRSFVYGGGQPGALTYNPQEDLSAANINASHLFLVEKTSNDLAYYTGESNLSAGYVMADQKYFDKLRAVYGVRYEKADIHVWNQKTDAEITRINDGAVLPSLNLSYALLEKMNLRASYFASVNRPEFRELAPFSFYVFDRNAEIRGNKDLQIAKLNNYDLRLEFFPSGSQVLSIGGFYKQINNPVEFSLDIAQVSTTFTYQNEKSAKVYGAEFEARKNFDFIGDAKILHDLSFFANLALIKSELTFEEGSQAKQGRPLQGQSPYVLNAGLQYENPDAGWFGSIAVNRIGRRIAFAGVDPQYGNTRQDIYEEPRTVLDVQLGKNIGKFNLKLTLGDLLKQNLTYYQDVDNNGKYSTGDRLMFQFTNGFSATLAAGYTF